MPPETRIVLFTGEGKGKTTAALGMALRAAGHGRQVCLVQFIKGMRATGESRAQALLPNVEHLVCGLGFVTTRAGAENEAPSPGGASPPPFVTTCAGAEYERHRQAAHDGLAQAAKRLSDPACHMVILDELCGALALGLLSLDQVCHALARATPGKIIVITGRDACKRLIALADTVSYMRNIKHAFDSGRSAQLGVEW